MEKQKPKKWNTLDGDGWDKVKVPRTNKKVDWVPAVDDVFIPEPKD